MNTNIFKAYDVRGLYPSQLNEDIAYRIGRCYGTELGASTLAVGRDMRASGRQIFEALAKGATEAGLDVIDVGLVSTDGLYFAVARYGYDAGIMITASHNPADYNGMKFTGKDAEPVSLATGLAKVRDKILSEDLGPRARTPGKVTSREVLSDFASHCLSFISLAQIKPFKLAIDAGNGMAGQTVPAVFEHLPCEVVPLYFELDGSFPNHPANPLEPQNMRDLQAAVVQHGCDLGVAFDGDADRMFIVDEQGRLVGGDIVTALVAINTLKNHPGETILYNLTSSRSVAEAIEKNGGKARRSPVGHSLIKKIMRDEDIIFGGEHSGHFYFKQNWYADSGMIALLQCLEVFSGQEAPVSEIVAEIDTRARSGELNSKVDNIPAKLESLAKHFSDGQIDYLDGLTIQYHDWWMNLRASNTEPLLRLNLECDTSELLHRRQQEILSLLQE